MQLKSQYLDVRTRQQMIQLRTILKLRLDLLEKDIGFQKRELINRAIDELSLTQLRKLRNVTNNIADEILAAYNNINAIKE